MLSSLSFLSLIYICFYFDISATNPTTQCKSCGIYEERPLLYMIHLTNGSFVPLISQLRVNMYTSRTTNSMLLFSAMDATQVGDGEFPQTVNLEL